MFISSSLGNALGEMESINNHSDPETAYPYPPSGGGLHQPTTLPTYEAVRQALILGQKLVRWGHVRPGQSHLKIKLIFSGCFAKTVYQEGAGRSIERDFFSWLVCRTEERANTRFITLRLQLSTIVWDE